MTDFLILAFVFLAAGVISVPVATKLGLGSVLGYLLAGIAISPILIALNVDVISIQHFAEFGVVMMLFLVGLELEPKMLWQMRYKLVGLGGLQVGLTAAAVIAIALAIGQPLSIAITAGIILSLSSTAIVLQVLGEKGLMRSGGGQSAFSVLLFQDIAVIPMLAAIPLLAIPELQQAATHALSQAGEAAAHGAQAVGEADHGSSFNLVENLAAWQAALVTIGAVALIVISGAYLTRPIFRYIAVAHLRELFIATALVFIVGIALLMTMVGLSPALGTFIAGVVLANSEFRHELESNIDPFRGLLLGLFFMTVGAAINFSLLFDQFLLILGLTILLIAVKCSILLVLGWIFGLRGSDKWLLGLCLAQAGEFCFVLLSFAVSSNALPPAIADQMLLVVALSMMLTPMLFIIFDKIIVPIYISSNEREADEIEPAGPVIVAGVGRFGGIINRMLLMAGHETTVLDYSAEHLDILRSFEVRAFYGDVTRPDLLHAAGIEQASALVVAIDQREAANQLVQYVNDNYPHVNIIARAIDRTHVYELHQAGAKDVIRETYESALYAGRATLRSLGMHPFEAETFSREFAAADRRLLNIVADLYDPTIPHHENMPYREKLREIGEKERERMKQRRSAYHSRSDRGWSRPSLEDLELAAQNESNKTK